MTVWDSLRAEFYFPPGTIYLDGNSLGLLSRRSEKQLLATVEQWKMFGVDGWGFGSECWIRLSERLSAMTAPLVGSSVENVCVTGSTTVNIHQLLATIYKPTAAKSKILMEEGAFPSDRYAVRSHLALHNGRGQDLVLIKPDKNRWFRTESIIELLNDEIALLLLPSVVYTTGQLLDIESIADAARHQGINVGIDCSHSVGAVPHQLDDWGVDFAVWCGYKYLNGGPGCVAGLYLNGRHHGKIPGLAGWFGVDKRRQFDMGHQPEFAQDASALQIGTPHILSMAPLIGALEMVDETGIANIRSRSLELTGYLMYLVDTVLAPFGFNVITPRGDHERGGHVALAHPDAIRVSRAMKRAGVIGDFRYPDIIRLAPVPFYINHQDLTNAASIIKEIMINRLFERESEERALIA